jgi:regulator of protease activity HflC (stomatin/prohibitin superfamily)
MKYICAGICGISFVTGAVLLICGFSSLEATEYGLDYSWISKTISPEVKENGLYFIGIGHSFIHFPKNLQTIEFSNDRTAVRKPIESRTSDGLEVTLEISFQYILLPEKLFELYNTFGPNYDKIFTNVAVDLLTEEATKYTAYDFFMDRGRIKTDFQLSLDKIFKDICFSNISFLQLRNVDLPNLFEQSIQESEVKKQDIQKANAELNKVTVEIDTRVKAAEFQKNVTINLAKGEAGAIQQENEAQVASLTQVQAAQGEAYKKLKENLGMTNTELLNYIKTKMVKNGHGQDMALNIESPELKQKK